MKRQVPGLHGATQNGDNDPRRPLPGSGRARLLPLASAEALLHPVPEHPRTQGYAGRTISGRLYSTPRALWKLSWFLRDFGYDTDLLGRDEVDEKALLGLRGIVRISHTVLNGRRFLNLERFAPAADWEELSTALVGTADRQEAAHDL